MKDIPESTQRAQQNQAAIGAKVKAGLNLENKPPQNIGLSSDVNDDTHFRQLQPSELSKVAGEKK